MRFRWSPIFETEPVGGPPEQPFYLNAALVVDGSKLEKFEPSKKAAINLLEKFLVLEKQYGRDRKSSQILWGPRTLDIDLLAWGSLQVKSRILTIPHPRLLERSFVVVPLAAALIQDEVAPPKISKVKKWA